MDPDEISAIKEELRSSLLSIASKLLASEHTRLHHLSKSEQLLWNSFEKADIYEFLTGDKDCIPEFQFNWFSPDAPAIRFLSRPTQAAPLPAAAPLQAAQPAIQVQAPAAVPAPDVPLQAPPQQPLDPGHQNPVLDQAGQPPAQKVFVQDRVLRDKVPVNYQELHTGVKKKCRSLQRKAKAVVTKLAPGSFSPKTETQSSSK
jgi:hypothetical protein